MNHRGVVVTLSAIIFFLSSCKEAPKVFSIPSLNKVTLHESKVLSNIYRDGTLSMMGFMKPNSRTRYCQAIKVLEGTLIGGWKYADVNFFKFGDEIVFLKDREYIHAPKKAFYSNSKINRVTRIQNIIGRIKSEQLNIIITDLFQNEADVNLLTKTLKEKCLLGNLAFGILGIRSECAGYIYDLGANKPAINYRSKKNPETYRSFL